MRIPSTNTLLLSTTSTYIEPLLKSTVISHQHHLNSRTIYHLLTKHCPTGTGSDSLPQWYLQLIAPAISTPFSIIFNNCINNSFFHHNGSPASSIQSQKLNILHHPMNFVPYQSPPSYHDFLKNSLSSNTFTHVSIIPQSNPILLTNLHFAQQGHPHQQLYTSPLSSLRY